MSQAQSIEIRIYYEDTDSGGVVYNANYLKFCERGRTEFMRHLGFNQQQLRQQNIAFAVRKASINYILPARLDDKITLTTAIQKLKKASVIFKQSIKRDNTILCQAEVVIACINADTFSPTAIPISIMSRLKQ